MSDVKKSRTLRLGLPCTFVGFKRPVIAIIISYDGLVTL